jgi:hypothetical protein
MMPISGAVKSVCNGGTGRSVDREQREVERGERRKERVRRTPEEEGSPSALAGGRADEPAFSAWQESIQETVPA